MKENYYFELNLLTERLHYHLLEIIKLELDGLGIHDINSVQAMMLFNIGDAEMTMGELTLRGFYLGSNVSYNVKKMAENGYLVHERSVHDRRTIRVRATEKGRALMRGTEAINQKRVLLIGDNPSEMRRLGEMIAAQGHQVTQAPDGPLGLRLAREQHPDLIVLHIESSSMSALEVAQNLKADDDTCGIPFVVITAYAKERQEELHANGCDAHVTKPSDLEVLTDLITSLAHKRPSRGVKYRWRARSPS